MVEHDDFGDFNDLTYYDDTTPSTPTDMIAEIERARRELDALQPPALPTWRQEGDRIYVTPQEYYDLRRALADSLVAASASPVNMYGGMRLMIVSEGEMAARKIQWLASRQERPTP